MKILKSENLNIFLLVFLTSVIAGYFLSFKFNIIFGDALARSFHAFLIFHGNESPKLGAVGFVWPPLQTLLQLPLVFITQLNIHGFAGNVLSSIFFGIATIYLNKIATHFKVNRFFKYIILLLFVTNPIIFFYGANGMSEMVGIAFILTTLYYFLKYLKTNSNAHLVLASIALSTAVLTRWETGTLLLVALIIISTIPFIKRKYSFREAESSIVLFTTPVLFFIFLWLLASWLIVGSPTYFLKSTYSFTQKDIENLATNSVISQAKGNVGYTLKFVLERVVYLSALFVPFLVLTLTKMFKKGNRLYALTLLGFAASVVLSQTMPIFAGKSYGQLRYFIYVIPLCSTLLFFIAKDTAKTSLKNYRTILLSASATIILLLSSFLSFQGMVKFGNLEENKITKIVSGKQYDLTNEPYDSEKQIANYLTSNIHTRSVLVDDSMGFNIVYLTQNTHLFIETVDSDFKASVKDPINSPAEYMLITNPEKTAGVDIVSLQYPGMFENGANFVELEKDFGPWRLYRIKKPNGNNNEIL